MNLIVAILLCCVWCSRSEPISIPIKLVDLSSDSYRNPILKENRCRALNYSSGGRPIILTLVPIDNILTSQQTISSTLRCNNTQAKTQLLPMTCPTTSVSSSKLKPTTTSSCGTFSTSQSPSISCTTCVKCFSMTEETTKPPNATTVTTEANMSPQSSCIPKTCSLPTVDQSKMKGFNGENQENIDPSFIDPKLIYALIADLNKFKN